MNRRKLGNTGFDVAPLAFGGNVFGWTADEATSFRLLDAFVGAGGNLIDTADSYSRWVPGHQGGESETIIGRWIARRGRHDDVVIATKVGSDMGLGYKCLRARLHPAGGRGVAAAPAGRRDRPLPVALGRRQDAVRRNARGLCAADPAGQGQGDRRVEPDGGAPGAGARRRAGDRLAALPDAAAALQPVRARQLRRPAGGPVRAREHRRDHVFLARGGVPHRQVPQRGGFRQEPARRRHAEVPQSARAARSWRRWRRVARRCNATLAQVALAWLMPRPSVTAPIASATIRCAARRN